MITRVVVGASVLIACGGGDGGGGAGQFEAGATCGFAIEVDGELADRIAARDSVACATYLESGEGIDLGFLALETELQAIRLHVDEVMRGETGGGFPATIELVHEDGREWTTDTCAVTVDAHTDEGPAEFGQSYRVTGSGECTMPATGATAAVTGEVMVVGAFAFVATTAWTD